MLAALDILECFGRFHYWGPFTLLMLCGLGAPLPEEFALIPSGIMVARGNVEYWPVTLVCSFAILLGDSIPFLLGRRYGLSVLRLRWVAKVLHPERFAKFERRFAEHGNWAIFTCRFLPGLRIPGYFLAGTMKMSYARFLLLDGLGVLISVPTSIYAAYWITLKLGEAKAEERVHQFLVGLMITVLVAAAGWLLYRYWRGRQAGEKTDSGA